MFGISVEDFKLAGAILVLLIALTMVQGDASHAHASTPKEREETRHLDSAASIPRVRGRL